MITVKDQEKRIRDEAAWCERQVKNLKKECASEISYTRKRSFERTDGIRARLKEVKAMGGVCNVHEAAKVLKVSRQRVSKIIGSGRIRRTNGELSLGDIKAYAKGPRKAGKPKSLPRGRGSKAPGATIKGKK